MSAIEVLKEVSLELKNGTLGKDLELGNIEQLLEIGIYKLQKKGYFKNKKALLALGKLDRLEKWLKDEIEKRDLDAEHCFNENDVLTESLIQRQIDILKEVRGVLKNE